MPRKISRAKATAPATAANHASSTHTATPVLDASPTPGEIAEAAYHRYLQRGGQHGGDFDDWIEAERELRERSANPRSQRPKPNVSQ